MSTDSKVFMLIPGPNHLRTRVPFELNSARGPVPPEMAIVGLTDRTLGSFFLDHVPEVDSRWCCNISFTIWALKPWLRSQHNFRWDCGSCLPFYSFSVLFSLVSSDRFISYLLNEDRRHIRPNRGFGLRHTNQALQGKGISHPSFSALTHRSTTIRTTACTRAHEHALTLCHHPPTHLQMIDTNAMKSASRANMASWCVLPFKKTRKLRTEKEKVHMHAYARAHTDTVAHTRTVLSGQEDHSHVCASIL